MTRIVAVLLTCIFILGCGRERKLINSSNIEEISDKVGEYTLPVDDLISGSVSDIKIFKDSLLFVSDLFKGKIQKLNMITNKITGFGAVGDGPGEYQNASSICFDDSNCVYINDKNDERLLKYSVSGKYIKDCEKKAFVPGTKMLYTSKKEMYFLTGCGNNEYYMAERNGKRIAKIPDVFYNAKTGTQVNDFFEHDNAIYFMNAVEFVVYKYNIKDNDIDRITLKNMPHNYNWKPYYDKSMDREEFSKILYKENKYFPVGFKQMLFKGTLYYVIMLFDIKDNSPQYYICDSDGEAILSFKSTNLLLIDTKENVLRFAKVDEIQGNIEKIVKYRIKGSLLE